MNKIRLVIGDYSEDGHSRKVNILLESNLTNKEMEAAYQKASKQMKFDFIKSVASEYEDKFLSLKYIYTLMDYGITFDYFDQVIEDDENDTILDVDAYTDIYLAIVKLGNPDFEYVLLDSEFTTIPIGGYGLFFS